MHASLRILFSSATLQMRQSFSRSMFKFCMIAYPILYGFMMMMLYQNRDASELVNYVMLGSAVSTLWGTISFSSAGDIDRERFMGALEVIFNAPTKFIVVMFGKVLGNTVLGVLSMAFSILFVMVFTKSRIVIQDPLLFLGVSVLGILSFAAIAMMLSGLLAISRSTRVLMNCMDYPIMILCGIAFPISILPSWTLPLSNVLSPTHYLVLARMSVTGVTSNALLQTHLIWLVGLTVFYSVVAIWTYGVIDMRARQKATLGVI